MDMREYIEQSINMDKKRLAHFKRLASTKVTGRLNCRFDNRKGSTYYYIKRPGDIREHYVNKSGFNLVWKLQQKRLAEEMIRILQSNIELKQYFCDMLMPDDIPAVITSLPKAYQPNSDLISRRKKQQIAQSENPYRRDRLVETTSFGLHVRSKGELAIAELLYSLGIEFYYEKALHLEVPVRSNNGTVYVPRTYYPDFTIILPDGRTFYWEHKGLMSSEDYIKRDIQKEIHYNLCGIYQPHNLIVTAEGPENDMDMEAIKRIIYGLLTPFNLI